MAAGGFVDAGLVVNADTSRGSGPGTATADAVVLALLQTGHLRSEDLLRLAAQVNRPVAPDHSAFTAVVEQACPAASLRTYTTTFRRLTAAFAAVPVDAVTATDLDTVIARIVDAAHARGHLDGTGAARGFIHGARFYYRQAVRHGHRLDNPAMSLSLPARRRRVRRALSAEELADIYRETAASSSDPGLDLLLLDFHRETAARRGGALGLRLCDLAPERPSVLLQEKGGHEREVPASPDLVRRLQVHAHQRGAAHAQDQVLRYRSGAPLTRRRYNTLFEHVQAGLPWAARLGVSVHWLRHTTLTDVSNAAGIRIAAAYAGHDERSVTDVYTVPTFEDLRRAHGLIFPTLADV